MQDKNVSQKEQLHIGLLLRLHNVMKPCTKYLNRCKFERNLSLTHWNELMPLNGKCNYINEHVKATILITN